MKGIRMIVLASLLPLTLPAQVHHVLLGDLKWRCIGPHRGGRTVGAVGIPQQPNVFYMGVNNGGVWKTTDYGRTWIPIFDDQPTGSIGDVAVAPSNPNIIYAASGEGLQRPDLSVGDGIYKSVNAGKTWQKMGLSDAQQIGGLAIDPKNENRVFVAALGHPYGPNDERGVYRSLNGGQSWERVLYIDENTGAVQVTIDPNNSNILFADLWAARLAPWENGVWNGANSGLYKSADGGSTWRKITQGLPTTQQGLGRIGFCIAPSDSRRMYATVDAGKEGGIYRSDDAGESWYRIQTDQRLWSRGSDFAEMKVDPKNADIVYSANVVTWKSTDGGENWTAFRGAPGGDDYHRIWINPDNPQIMLLAGDQGAIITVNGGETFSSWYNQPTAQFYHVITDNEFPYNVYGGQQESGSVGIASRGNDGSIGIREWHPVGVEEYGYVAPDPLNPNLIYGGKITRYDKRTGQVQNIAPEAVRSGQYRFLRTAPVIFSQADPHVLFFAGNVLFKTTNGGVDWEKISPDLSREQWEIPQNVGIYNTEDLKKMKRRGVIYTVAPSPLNVNLIWCGTDDGLIHITHDGGTTWKNITPPGLGSWSKVSLIEASRYDTGTAYAALNRIRCSDMRPHIYKTTDGGVTWKEIVNGLPNEPINAVREDPKTRGLLYAGSEGAVYFSLDDGENWQSLRFNMPATSIRDLVVKDDDIVVGTHGRSFWILDNISRLRQVSNFGKGGNAWPVAGLFKPATAYRVRWNQNTDTPIPQEEPAGENPPDGAMIEYYMGKGVDRVSLEIFDESGQLVRQFGNTDTAYAIPEVNIPHYWIRPQQILSAEAGTHRFIWDLKYEPLPVPASYPISATYKNTAPEPTAPWVMPGRYKLRLTANDAVFETYLEVKMDPRVTTSLADLKLQHRLSLLAYQNLKNLERLNRQISGMRKWMNLQPDQKKAAVKKLKSQLDILEKPMANGLSRIAYLESGFAAVFEILQGSDMKPTTQAVKAVEELQQIYQIVFTDWMRLENPVK